jgi:dTDP-4-amino-4,6-dideoxygalactose transaminase
VTLVPFFELKRQYRELEAEIWEATKRVYESGRFILGEEVLAFEEAFARYLGVPYGVGVGSGTDALCLALKAAGVGEGDEVITVAHSFIATALAISFTGAKPLFVDIEPGTYTMDPNALEDFLASPAIRRRRKKIKAILPVHLYGQSADMTSLLEIAARYDLLVIEDACQAHGADWCGKKVGTLGNLGCFSFYPTKNLGGYGDGGMVMTKDKDLNEKLRLLRCYGEQGKYRHILKGHNSRLDEMQAAVLRIKLRSLDRKNDDRRDRAGIYTERLKGTPVVSPVEKGSGRHVYHLYVIRSKKRDLLQAFLKEKGIDTLIHYPIPIHLQKAYRDLGYGRGDLPRTEKACNEILSLPFFPEITGGEIGEVAEAIRSFADHSAGKRGGRR